MCKSSFPSMGHARNRKLKKRAHIRKLDRWALRQKLMRQIYKELDRGGMLIRSRQVAPLVFDLADKAKTSRSRTFIFHGVKFKLRPGMLWLNICDEFGAIIFSTDGGLL